jgi:hypothetical protein
MKYEYTCKFCQKPGFVITGDAPMELEAGKRWYPMLCCNRCGDFRISLRKARHALMNIARQLATAAPAKIGELRAAKTDAIESITKRISTLACDYYRVQNVWCADFVDQILEKPDKADIIVKVYVNGISKISKEGRTPHND